MANLLDRFYKDVVGSKDKIFDYIPIIDSSGDFKRIYDLDVILNSWNNILITPRGSYIFDPEYGSDLLKYIFSPSDAKTVEDIKNEIIYTIRKYDDRATISSIDVLFLRNKKGFDINIDVEYNRQTKKLSTKIDENIYFNFLRLSNT